MGILEKMFIRMTTVKVDLGERSSKHFEYIGKPAFLLIDGKKVWGKIEKEYIGGDAGLIFRTDAGAKHELAQVYIPKG